ncbi:MAG: flagellar hook-length control protein FliK [Bosea sp. (in: a-proteobacteria)]
MPSSPLSSVAPSQHSRAEVARKTAEPFVLPPEDKAPQRRVAERRQAETDETTTSSQRPQTTNAVAQQPLRKTESTADQSVAKHSAEANDSAASRSTSLVGTDENAQKNEAEVEIAPDVSEAAATAAEQGATAADVIQQQVAETAVIMAQQFQALAELATNNAGDQLVTDADTLEAAAAMMQAKAAEDQEAAVGAEPSGAGAGEVSKSSTAPALSTGTGEATILALAIPGSDKVVLTDDLAAKSVKERAEALKITAAEGGKPELVAPDGTEATSTPADSKSAADKKADQASTTAGLAKLDLASRLEQNFAQPISRPAEIAPAPLPPPSQLPELPRAIPPSAVPMEIGLRSLQGMKEFQIRLDPAELGRIDVKLEIGDDKSVTARVVVDRVETLHLLQREAKTLERAFEQAGLKSSDASVDISLRDPGQQSQQGRRDGAFDQNEAGAKDRYGRPATVEMPIIPIRRTLHVGALDRSI